MTSLAAQTLERIPPPSVEGFQRTHVVPQRPVVLAGLVSDWPAMRRWSLEYLHGVFARTPITAARVDAGMVVMDKTVGLIFERMPLGAFIDSLRAGARDRYLQSPLAELPDDLRRDAPPPPYSAEAT